ncbi:MAG: hypothetical protein LBN43_01550 [Oscillospiraceae bacterium]|jgi:hypothetical protein|nr:hypothetical protein [Oscillospiraceae bacterium]
MQNLIKADPANGAEAVNIDDLADIRDVAIDTSLPQDKRAKSYIQQIKNPQLYRYDDTVVRTSFANTNVALTERLKQYLLSKQGLIF